MNFFYNYYEMKLHLFVLLEFIQRKDRGRKNANMLTMPTDDRVVASTVNN